MSAAAAAPVRPGSVGAPQAPAVVRTGGGRRWPGGGFGARLRRRLALAWGLLAVMGLLLAPEAGAQEVQPVPALSGRIVDAVGLLDAGQAQALDAKLAAFEARSGPQIVLLLVSRTAPEDIASYAQRVADSWKIGRRGVGDGLLLVVARDDRRVRIEVAKALEGAVPDLAARQIIERQISPAFKRGDYAGGLNAGVDALVARIQGEGLPAPAATNGPLAGPASGFDWEELAIFFFVAVPVAGAVFSGLLGRRAGSLVTGLGTGALAAGLGASLVVAGVAALAALLLVGVIGVGSGGRRSGLGGVAAGLPIGWGGGHGGSWGGGSSGDSGGGFSSGGGGDFGGGGASGDW